MSEFDRQNEEVFAMVHNNPYRTGVKRDAGYIITAEQAERLAVLETSERKGQCSGVIGLCLAALAVTVSFVLALA